MKSLVKENATSEEAFSAMSEYLKKYNRKASYYRAWQAPTQKEGELTFDFGSHSEFFLWQD